MNLNYFDYFELPQSFNIDTELLKKQFLAKSRQYHPDFYAQADAKTQEHALEMATINNKAYQILSDADLRMAYLLNLYGMMPENERYELAKDFLLDMLELNEAIMELQIDFDAASAENIKLQLQDLETALQNEIQPVIENFDKQPNKAESLKKIKEFYYKKRYLLRIRKTLLTFATQ